MREEAGRVALERAWIAVTGPDAAEYLQSQVTNDVGALEVGDALYAALLDRKGRIQADMRISRVEPDRFLIDTEPAAADALSGHLDTYRIGREVEVAAVVKDGISLLGPAAQAKVELPRGGEGKTATVRIGRHDCLAITTPWGADLVVDVGATEDLGTELDRLGFEPVSGGAAEILRIEAGRPRFGREIGNSTMPAEAGIVERAVSFEKGCYIGQEPVARLHYKGKPNRFLRGLKFDSAVEAGATLSDGERELGTVGSVALSPAEGWIGLAIVRREAGPGDRIEASFDGGTVGAEVVDLPFPAATEGGP